MARREKERFRFTERVEFLSFSYQLLPTCPPPSITVNSSHDNMVENVISIRTSSMLFDRAG